jgi:dipeptidyl aminopeptidase/acylaminoacyl peptidase
LFLWRDDDPEIAYAAYLALIGWRPEEKPELFQARSAVYWPELINVPVLLLHGEVDGDISADHTVALSGALQNAGRPHEVIIFPGGDHYLNSYHNGLVEALNWFQQFFGYDGVDRTYGPHDEAIRVTTDGFWRR